MAMVSINDQNLKDIASAIREKNGLTSQYRPKDMASAIRDIQAGGGKKVETGTFTQQYTFRTNLSNIEIFIIYAERLTSYGMMSAFCKQGESAIVDICSYYSQYSSSCKISTTSSFKFEGGDFTWEGTGEYGFMEGATYNWIAIGE